MSDGICITENQRKAHIATELAALAVVMPFSFWLAGRRELPIAARALSGAIGVVTLVVDGIFIARYVQLSKSASEPDSTSISPPPSQPGPSGQLSHPLFP
ncbi:hypothetical protein LCGC14_0832450 [marine sediment metagenome]|uniref:Uncharacterized protein n=1 Tax=marine sediment metagenome TaxID=412755 RepID=A0A0F9S096_9ZZZZ